MTDREMVQLICAFRLKFPDVGLVLSTREPARLRAGDIVDVPLAEPLAVPRRVDVSSDPVIPARGMGISFGDE